MGIGLQEPQVGIRVMNLTRVFLRASELNRFYPGGVHAVGVSMLVLGITHAKVSSKAVRASSRDGSSTGWMAGLVKACER